MMGMCLETMHLLVRIPRVLSRKDICAGGIRERGWLA